MKLSDKHREIFIEYAHQKLEEYSRFHAEELLSEKSVKPFGELEEKAVDAIRANPEGFKSYFEKVLWQCSQGVLFDLFCVIDGVADPDDPNWKGVLLIDMPKEHNEHVEFLHDDL